MSESVSLTTTAVITGLIVSRGTAIVRKSIEELTDGLSSVARAAYNNAANREVFHDIGELLSARQIRDEIKTRPAAPVNKGSIEEIKGRFLADVAARPYLVSDESSLDHGFSMIKKAVTLPELEKATNSFVEAVEAGHQTVFAGALLHSCRNAALKIGFTRIEALRSPIHSEITRFSATDPIGRTLITEIRAAGHQPAQVEAEVIGVRDGTCGDIIDSFIKALEDEGVRSQPPKRKFTGGVCELAAARHFLASRAPTPNPEDETKKASRTDPKRRQRLNRVKQNLKQR